MDGFAQQIHAHAGSDGRDIKCAQQLDNGFQSLKNIFFGDDDFRVITADILCNLFGIFQVNGIFAHTDGKGADRLFAFFGSDGTDQGRV